MSEKEMIINMNDFFIKYDCDINPNSVKLIVLCVYSKSNIIFELQVKIKHSHRGFLETSSEEIIEEENLISHTTEEIKKHFFHLEILDEEMFLKEIEREKRGMDIHVKESDINKWCFHKTGDFPISQDFINIKNHSLINIMVYELLNDFNCEN